MRRAWVSCAEEARKQTRVSVGKYRISAGNALRICFVADARSPIARNWITHFIASGDEVHVIALYRCSPYTLPGATVYQVPTAFSDFSRASQQNKASADELPRGSAFSSLRSAAFVKLSLAAQHFVLPITARRQVPPVRELIEGIGPDFVHAMRIPFEGIIAAKAMPQGLPLLISVWGNDFTFWARNPIIARQTRQALKRADALHSDCRRDLKLAESWGFNAGKPQEVLPGAGGVQTGVFHPGEPDTELRKQFGIAGDAPIVINPRGPRPNVRTDVFFKAIPIVLRQYPKAMFLCSALKGNAQAERWARRLAIQNSVRLLPSVPRERMSDFFRLALVTVSPSLHDGTPNTLLEAMACGCFPVAGDIESLREWITDGTNGLLCDAKDPESLARAVVRALGDDRMRSRAREHNLTLIAERAEYGMVMQKAEAFYAKIAHPKGRRAE